MRKVRLGEYIEQRREKYVSGNYPIRGVTCEGFIPPKQKEADISLYNVFYKYDFVFNPARMEINSIALNMDFDKAICSSLYEIFYIKDTKKILPEYLNLLLKRKEFARFCEYSAIGSARNYFRVANMLNIEIPLPDIEVQRELVAAWQGLKELADNNAQMADPLFALCQSYLKDLKQKYPMQEIGPYLAQCDERNNQGLLGENDVRGLATSKQLIETKANLDGVSLSSYKLLKAEEFAFVPDTSRRGDKMSLGFNREAKNYIVSSISCVFRIKDKNKLLPDFLYLWFSRPEFDRYARFNSWGSARETFSFSEMCRVKIPLPPIEVQKAIVAIYRCAQENKAIAGEAAALSKSICPALMRQAMAGGEA